MTHAAAETAKGYKFHHTILREYDIRGIVGETLSETDAYYIGKAFGTFVQNQREEANKICVGYDGRLSSPMLQQALVNGLLETGVDVINVGQGPTPMLYYAVRSMNADAGIMVTGSHNPPTHNGFKMMLRKESVYGSDIRELGTIAAGGIFAEGKGELIAKDIRDEYLNTLMKDFEGARPLKVVWDAGNGAAGEMMALLADRLPGEHILLNQEIDGTFPAHHPDPTVPENLEQLIEVVKSKGCDLGLAFDGDGDRLGIVDDKGAIIWGDQMMVFFAQDVLKHEPGATIIADVKASQTLFDKIAEMGGNPLMWKTGHSLIKAKMIETGSPLAGEMSGHIFFADRYYGFDDALYAAVRIIQIMANTDKPLSSMRESLPQVVNTPEIRINCPEERKFAIIQEVRQRLEASGTEYNDVDGVRVNTEHGWWLLRASNTQSVLVARCEATSKEALTPLLENVREQLQQSGLSWNQ